MRRGDVIKDAQLQNPSRCGHCLIAASMYHSAGNMMSAREQVLGCNCQQSGVLSFGKVAAKVAAREGTTSKFWEQSIIDDRSCPRGAATCPTLSVSISPAGLKCWCRNPSRLASQAPARRACATRPLV